MCCPTALAPLQLAGMPARKGGLSPSAPLASPPAPSPGTELPPRGDTSPPSGVGESDQSAPLPKAAEEPDCPLREALLTRRGEDGFAFRIRYPIACSYY